MQLCHLCELLFFSSREAYKTCWGFCFVLGVCVCVCVWWGEEGRAWFCHVFCLFVLDFIMMCDRSSSAFEKNTGSQVLNSFTTEKTCVLWQKQADQHFGCILWQSWVCHEVITISMHLRSIWKSNSLPVTCKLPVTGILRACVEVPTVGPVQGFPASSRPCRRAQHSPQCCWCCRKDTGFILGRVGPGREGKRQGTALQLPGQGKRRAGGAPGARVDIPLQHRQACGGTGEKGASEGNHCAVSIGTLCFVLPPIVLWNRSSGTFSSNRGEGEKSGVVLSLRDFFKTNFKKEKTFILTYLLFVLRIKLYPFIYISVWKEFELATNICIFLIDSHVIFSFGTMVFLEIISQLSSEQVS